LFHPPNTRTSSDFIGRHPMSQPVTGRSRLSFSHLEDGFARSKTSMELVRYA